MTDPFDAWEFENEEQRKEMMEEITEKNCYKKLRLIRNISGMSRRDLAKVLGVSESTIKRLELKSTKPTQEFMLKLAALSVIGHQKYSKMKDSDREKVSEAIGAAGGVAAGVGASIAAISASGAVAGLSAAGITSGLAAVGGGAMIGGVAVIASIPLAVGGAGYGLIKGVKAICKANRLNCKEVDGKYEIAPDSEEDEDQDGEKGGV